MRKHEIELWVEFVNFSVLSISLGYVLTFGKIGVFFTKAEKIVAVNIFFQKVRSFFIKLCELAGMVSTERNVFSQNYANCGLILAE